MYDIISYCDAYSAMGMGHIGRQLGILNEFISENESLRIGVKGKFSDTALNFILKQKHELITVLSPTVNSKSRLALIDTMFFSGEQKLDYDFFQKVSLLSDKIIFIWDTFSVRLPKEVDIYINHLPYAITERSRDDQKIFIGFSYLPVQSKYFYSNNYDVKGDILFVIGGSDTPENLRILLSAVEELFLVKKITMIFSPSYESNYIELLKIEYSNIEILQNVDDLMPYFNNSSAIVTTYGSTTFQALAAKRPVFTVGLLEFQDIYGNKLEETGYSINLGLLSHFDMLKFTYLNNDNFLREKQNLLSSVFIEPGIKNIIKIIKNQLS